MEQLSKSLYRMPLTKEPGIPLAFRGVSDYIGDDPIWN
jgi:hypothetical protein